MAKTKKPKDDSAVIAKIFEAILDKKIDKKFKISTPREKAAVIVAQVLDYVGQGGRIVKKRVTLQPIISFNDSTITSSEDRLVDFAASIISAKKPIGIGE